MNRGRRTANTTPAKSERSTPISTASRVANILEQLLESLPEREREIVELRFFGELPQAAIGRRVGLSQMHVSRLLAVSLARLRATAAERASFVGGLTARRERDALTRRRIRAAALGELGLVAERAVPAVVEQFEPPEFLRE